MDNRRSPGVRSEFSGRVLRIVMKLAYFLRADKEGKAMLFLLRTAFWLMIIVLLLPTDERQRAKSMARRRPRCTTSRRSAITNPETCAKGKDAFGVLVQKAQFGARMLIDLVNGTKSAGEGEGRTGLRPRAGYPEQNSGTNFPYEPSRLGSDGSQDTLNPDDRDEAWAVLGPKASQGRLLAARRSIFTA